MFCTACAAPILADVARCAACGEHLGGPPSAPNPRPSRRRGLLPAIYAVPLLVLVFSGLIVAARYRAGQADLAVWYARAEAAAAAGRHAEAADAFAAAGGYRDAEARRGAAAAALVPYRAAYLDGLAALDAGRHDDAIAALLPVVRDLPDYADAAALLDRARAARADGLRHQADAAETRGEWLAADRALAALAADAPDDAALATRLATLRRQHAPLVVARDRALHLVSRDGLDDRVLVQSVSATWPAWSPDRTRIAFLSIDHADPAANTSLYVVNTDGTGLTRLDDWVSYYDAPLWSPDGTRIAYVTLAAWSGSVENGKLSIRVAEVATGQVTDVTRDTLRLAFFPSWSPTGDRLAFVAKTQQRNQPLRAAEGEVHVLTLATGELTNITRGRLPDAWSVAWSPTDERLLVFTVDADSDYDLSETGISLLDARTGALSVVRAGSETVMPPVWSPHGDRFAFADGPTSVRIRDDGSGESWINLRTDIQGHLTWSPDGGTILAVADDPRQDAYFISVADGDPVALKFAYDATASGSPGLPQWSPLNLAEPPAAPSVTGTALDPDASGG